MYVGPNGFQLVEKVNKHGKDVSIRDIKLNGKFCLILQTDGKVMSMGQSDNGCLGVENETNSSEKSIFVQLPHNELIVSIQTGRNHCLALSDSGRVYAWGSNAKGQVGISASASEQLSHEEIDKKMV